MKKKDNKNENFGCKVQIKLFSNKRTIIFHNVTEIHYCYNPEYGDEKRCAFESDIHNTGATYPIRNIMSFETELETKKEKNF